MKLLHCRTVLHIRRLEAQQLIHLHSDPMLRFSPEMPGAYAKPIFAECRPSKPSSCIISFTRETLTAGGSP